MDHIPTNRFVPDYAVHPGEILQETLEARGIKRAEFAKRCGLSNKTVRLIINGKAPVKPGTAIQFERVLGVSAAVWNNLEAFYRLHTAQDSARKDIEKQSEWAQKFPIAQLVERGIFKNPVDAIDAVEKLLNFFALGSIDAWKKRLKEMSGMYQHCPSFLSMPESVSTWLRLGELYAESIETNPYSKSKFNKTLEDIQALTIEPPRIFERKIKELCAGAGVALVFVCEFPGTHLRGATSWLNNNKALILLNRLYKSDDLLWFSFFHEAAHILLHGKRKAFLDEKDGLLDKKDGLPDEKDRLLRDKEDEANRFARNMLIPADRYADFIARGDFSKKAIVTFAKRIETAPGIVVGRLQEEAKIRHDRHNELKRRVIFAEIKKLS